MRQLSTESFVTFKIAEGEILVSGPGIDAMISAIHNMLGRGAPVKKDDLGGSGVSYRVFSTFYGDSPGDAIDWQKVIGGMQALQIHKNTQLASIGVDYDQLRAAVVADYNRVVGESRQQNTNPNKITFIGEFEISSKKGKKYPKVIFGIVNLTRYPKVKQAISAEMEKRVQEGQTWYQARTDNWGKFAYPTYMVFQKSNQHIDGWEIDPQFLSVIEPPLKEMGYDTTEMLQYIESHPDTTSRPVKKVSAQLQGRTLIIDFGQYLGRNITQQIKNLGYRNQQIGGQWKTIHDDPTVPTIEDLIALIEPLGYDCSELKDVIEQLGSMEPEPEAEEGKYALQVRDVTGETNGRWHMAIKFLRKNTYEGEALKDVLKYSFIEWAKDMNDPEGTRTINKDTWETYIAGDMQEYMNFINSLNNRGFDSSPISAIVGSLIENNIVLPMEGIGFLDGFESKEEFMAALDQYNLPFELYPDQKGSVQKIYSHKSFIGGHATGTGKTVMSVLAADMRMKKFGGRTVVITKNAVVDQFAEEIARFIGLDINDKTQISTNPLDKAQWTVLSYTSFSAPGSNMKAPEPGVLNGRVEFTNELVKQAQNGEIRCVILDECHTVKNGSPTSRSENRRGLRPDQLQEAIKNRNHASNHTTFNVQDFSANVPMAWGLSATVVANFAVDVYNQLKAVNHPLGKMSWGKFAVEFGAMKPGRFGLEPGTIDEQLEAVNKLKEFMFDQNVYDALSKEQLNEEMPDQIISKNVIPVDVGRLGARVSQRLKGYKNPDLEVSQMQAFRNEVAIMKAPSTVQSAINILEQGKRVMIFTDFKDSLDIMQLGLQKYFNEKGAGQKVLAIKGGMRKKTKTQAIRDFKDPNSGADAIVINIIAGGTGLDFPNITTDVFVNDFDWSVANDEQMLGRAFRINSLEDVNVRYTIADETPDREYYERLEAKKKVADVIHKMSMKQEDLMKEGHRRGRSKQLAEVEKKLNEAKKKLLALEGNDTQFNKQQVRRFSRSNNWYKTIK